MLLTLERIFCWYTSYSDRHLDNFPLHRSNTSPKSVLLTTPITTTTVRSVIHPTIPVSHLRTSTRQPRTGQLINERPAFPTSISKMTSPIIGGGNTITNPSSAPFSQNSLKIVNLSPTRPMTLTYSTTRRNIIQWPSVAPTTTQRPFVVWPTSTKAPEKGASFWQNWSPNKDVEVISDNSLTHTHEDLIGPLITATSRRPLTSFNPSTPSKADVELLDPWLLEILEQARQNASSFNNQHIPISLSSFGAGSINSTHTTATSIPVIR